MGCFFRIYAPHASRLCRDEPVQDDVAACFDYYAGLAEKLDTRQGMPVDVGHADFEVCTRGGGQLGQGGSGSVGAEGQARAAVQAGAVSQAGPSLRMFPSSVSFPQ